MKKYVEATLRLKASFTHFQLDKINYQQNIEADHFSQIASGDIPNDLPVAVEVCSTPFISKSNLIMYNEAEPKSWIDEIKDFIEQYILLVDPVEA